MGAPLLIAVLLLEQATRFATCGCNSMSGKFRVGEWLESVEDTGLVKEARLTLQAASGDREKAGWLRWDDVKKELE